MFLPHVCPNMSVCTRPYFSTSTRDEGFTIRWFPMNAKPLSGIRTKYVVRIQVERRFSFASQFALSLLNCGLPEMEGKLHYIYFQFNSSHLTKWAGINHLHPLCAFKRMVYRVAHLLREKDMLTPNLKLCSAVNLSCDSDHSIINKENSSELL